MFRIVKLSKNDLPSGQVERRTPYVYPHSCFNRFFVSAIFAGHKGDHSVTIGQLDLVSSIRPNVDHDTFSEDGIFSEHVRISGSPLVTKTVCSK